MGDSFRKFIEPTKELAQSQDKDVHISIEETNIHINPEKYKTFFPVFFMFLETLLITV